VRNIFYIVSANADGVNLIDIFHIMLLLEGNYESCIFY